MSSFNFKKKVAIIGVGYVGASIAYALTLKDLADEIILIDHSYDKSCGEADDIRHGIPFMGVSNVKSGSYSDISNCDLIIITAGRNRKKGENRLNLAKDNINTLRGIFNEIEKYYTDSVILLVTNPVDIAAYKVEQWTGMKSGKIIGSGCILDTSRLTSEVASYVNLSTDNVRAMVIGEHGDTQVPVWSKLLVAGIPIKEYCDAVNILWDEEQMLLIADKVKRMGASIISNKDRTHYGIATCVCYIADAVLSTRRAVVSVSSTLVGEYGISDVALSIPSIISSNGIEKRIVEKLEEYEKKALHNSANKLYEIQQLVKDI